MEEKLHKVSAYLTKDELREFELFVKARGATQSGYIREMLGFDIRERGAPKGPRKQKAEHAKQVKSKRAGKEKESKQGTAKLSAPQLPFLD